MSIKILGGLAKGQTLLVPKGDLIRPTSVMLRRKIFDARQDMSGYKFYDLCAGTGAMGLEALSRGADSVTLVEPNSKVYSLTKKNSENISKSSDRVGQIELVKSNAEKWLERFLSTYETLDDETKESIVLFLDPPYLLHDVYNKCLDLISKVNFVGELWIESDEQKGIKKKVLDELFPNSKSYSQGTSFILIVR
ncbi:RsmD family RNA methyltransferase [Halobacteriovorax sp.]|uniref:RsmD family RNA methyltransferase n=1 Tax=Halobacteriovorax sp. TaxID=2020862 RepID=UPI0035663D0F